MAKTTVEPIGNVSDEGLGMDAKIAVASQAQLMWWRFRRSKLAVVAVVFLVFLYSTAILAEFVAIYDPHDTWSGARWIPPQVPSFIDGEGKLAFPPVVFGLEQFQDPKTRRITYTVDKSVSYPVRLLVRGAPYKFWNVWEGDLRLLGLPTEAYEEREDGLIFRLYILGSDSLGRCILSRLVYGARISLSIGLIGVFISLFLGILIGGFSGYRAGATDMIIQRVIEFLRSVPRLPLWMGLTAALPPDLPQTTRYFGIVVILSFFGWTGMARTVRGRFLAMRTEDFVLAARLNGTPIIRIIFRHMLPSFISHIIASITLAIPGMILGETGLSFLGLGLQKPIISWGVMLNEARNIQAITLTPWVLLPAILLILTVLAYNFMGDGLRDAADPYAG